MVSRRKKKRKLKKILRNMLIALPIAAGVFLLLFFGFRIKTVDYVSDINQFRADEVQNYLVSHKIENSLWFWFRNLIGLEKDIDLFESYSVSLKSPVKIKIDAQEKKLRGSFIDADNEYYFDSAGEILKSELCNYKKTKKGKKKLQANSLGICRFTGISFQKPALYQQINTTEKEGRETIRHMIEAFDEMEIALDKVSEENGKQPGISINKIAVSDQYEIVMHLKKGLKVALGKDNQLKEKMDAFVDIYSSTKAQLTAVPGTLQMQWIMTDGSYTFIKDEKKSTKK